MQTGKYFCVVLLFLAFTLRTLVQGQDARLKFEHINSDEGLPQNTIHGIVKDKYGFMWFGTWGGLCRYDGYSFKVYKYDPANPKSINNNRIHNLIKDDQHNLWILTFKKNELCKYNYQTDDFERVSTAKVNKSLLSRLSRWDHYTNINFADKHHSWKIDRFNNSLLQTNLSSGVQTYYKPNADNRWSISGARPSDLYLDDQQQLWVGTYSSGINKANLKAKPFDYLYHDPKTKQSLADNDVRAIAEDHEGNIWIGTYDKGISIIRPDGKYSQLYLGEKDTENFTYDQIKAIYCDNGGMIWIGSKKGLSVFNPKTGRIRKFPELEKDHISIYSITEDQSHDLWFASYYRGVFKYDRRKDQLRQYRLKDLLRGNPSRTILRDSKNQIWLGTEGAGLMVFKMDVKRDTILLQKHFSNRAKPLNKNQASLNLSDNSITCLYEDRKQLIWIGTANGLSCYDPFRKSISRISELAGLKNLSVAAIIEDEAGMLWVSHQGGLLRLDKNTLKYRNYTIKDGLQSNEFQTSAALKSRSSAKLYFGSVNGINVFRPEEIRTEKSLAYPLLTELEVLNKKIDVNEQINDHVILHQPLYLSSAIDLNHEENNIGLSFSAMHYANPSANRYAYMLEGFDQNWIYTDAERRTANYTNLPSGNYLFKVIATNSDGVWNKQPATLKIRIHPAFWASPLAYLIYAVLVLCAFYLYHHYSKKYAAIRSKLDYEIISRQKESDLQQSKLQFFTNLSHEIKTPLTLILAPIEKLSGKFTTDPDAKQQLNTMKKNAERLLNMVNQLLDFRRIESNHIQLKLEADDFVAFLNELIQSFQPLAAEKAITMRCTSSFKSLYCSYDKDKLEKVFSNLLSNALKFTPESGTVETIIRTEAVDTKKTVVVDVMNTGIKIPEEQRELIFRPFEKAKGNFQDGTGLGLAFTKELLRHHGAKIEIRDTWINTNEPATCFSVTLPTITIFKDSQNEDVSEALKSSILIVDDNPDIREYLRDHLNEQYIVFEAINGQQGIEVAQNKVPDLIISDVMMDPVDGIVLCKTLKSALKTGHIPIILLTAKAPLQTQIEGLETGADDYITKPFNLALLDARIRNLLLSRQQLKENYRRNSTTISANPLPDSADDLMFRKFMEYIQKRLSDPQLNVEDICEHVGSSRSNLYRKIRNITGLGLAELIKEVRLKQAILLLKENKFTVSEVAFQIGFTDAEYFSKCFKAEFGVSPSAYMKNKKDRLTNL